MTEFLLIRHGQTDWNIERRYQGQTDIPLNVSGVLQAQQLANTLPPLEYAAIYSSDLSRAQQTAAIIAEKFGLPIYIDRRLREINLGTWEGRLHDEVKQRFPVLYERVRTDVEHAHAPGGETLQQVAQRVSHAAYHITRCHPDKSVIIVSHGLALSTLACQAQGHPLTEVYSFGFENCVPYRTHWPPQQNQA